MPIPRIYSAYKSSRYWYVECAYPRNSHIHGSCVLQVSRKAKWMIFSTTVRECDGFALELFESYYSGGDVEYQNGMGITLIKGKTIGDEER